jgi:hypothetical protein
MDFLQQQGLLVKHQLIMTASMKITRPVAPSGGVQQT